MALSRGRRYEPVNYWPGFVDALSTMLLVIIFLLSVFMLAQFFLVARGYGQGRGARQAQSADRGTDQSARARAHPERRRRKQDIGPHRHARLRPAGRRSALKDAASRGAVDADAASGQGLGGGHRARSAEADFGAGAGPGRRAQPADRGAAQAARGDRGCARRIGVGKQGIAVEDRRPRPAAQRRAGAEGSGAQSLSLGLFRPPAADPRLPARYPGGGRSVRVPILGAVRRRQGRHQPGRAASRSTRSPPP